MANGAPMKSILPGQHAKPYSVGSGYRTSPTNCDDPVHGGGPGEIVFHHMSVVQRGVRCRHHSWKLRLPNLLSAVSSTMATRSDLSKVLSDAPTPRCAPRFGVNFAGRDLRSGCATTNAPRPSPTTPAPPTRWRASAENHYSNRNGRRIGASRSFPRIL
jgi:hypothetical protein